MLLFLLLASYLTIAIQFYYNIALKAVYKFQYLQNCLSGVVFMYCFSFLRESQMEFWTFKYRLLFVPRFKTSTYIGYISFSVAALCSNSMEHNPEQSEARGLYNNICLYCAMSVHSSYPSSSYSNFYVGSMYDDIRLHVARSYTSSADSPFSLISSFTLSSHLLLGLPLFLLPCTFIYIALLPT